MRTIDFILIHMKREIHARERKLALYYLTLKEANEKRISCWVTILQ